MSDPVIQLSDLPMQRGIEKLTTQQQAYERLRYSLMTGRILPGTSLTIRGIAEILNISPTPAREALKKLCAEGALTELDNRRVITPIMNIERFNELIKLRILLECHAAKSAMNYINEHLIDSLEEIDERMDVALQEDNHEAIVVMNQQFHSNLYKANPNQVHMPLIESIWLQLGPYTRVAINRLSDIYLVDRHKQMIKALRNRNSAALLTAIEKDISEGIGQMGREYLGKEGKKGRRD